VIKYYVLDTGSSPRRWIGEYPHDYGSLFRKGHIITVQLPAPLRYSLRPIVRDSYDHGPYMASYMKPAMPLFRADLIAAMYEAGVRELDTYDAIIEDPERPGQPHTNYKAVNVLGLVGAADMQLSEYTEHPGGPVGDVDFDHLVIDPNKARGRLIFRLAESTNIIMIRESVRDHLLAKGFNDLEFYDPGKIAT
jgi:hypothetical protein